MRLRWMNSTRWTINTATMLCLLMGTAAAAKGKPPQKNSSQESKKAEAEKQKCRGGKCGCGKAADDKQQPADSPGALLNRSKELGLGEKQILRLKEIQKETRELARNLLTSAQRRKLATSKNTATDQESKSSGNRKKMPAGKCGCKCCQNKKSSQPASQRQSKTEKNKSRKNKKKPGKKSKSRDK